MNNYILFRYGFVLQVLFLYKYLVIKQTYTSEIYYEFGTRVFIYLTATRWQQCTVKACSLFSYCITVGKFPGAPSGEECWYQRFVPSCMIVVVVQWHQNISTTEMTAIGIKKHCVSHGDVQRKILTKIQWALPTRPAGLLRCCTTINVVVKQ